MYANSEFQKVLNETYFLIVLDLVVQNSSIGKSRCLPRQSKAVLGCPVLSHHTYQRRCCKERKTKLISRHNFQSLNLCCVSSKKNTLFCVEDTTWQCQINTKWLKVYSIQVREEIEIQETFKYSKMKTRAHSPLDLSRRKFFLELGFVFGF